MSSMVDSFFWVSLLFVSAVLYVVSLLIDDTSCMVDLVVCMVISRLHIFGVCLHSSSIDLWFS